MSAPLSGYREFLSNKRILAEATGITDPPELHSSLFPFQRDIVRWALRRGRAALFEDCGLGKSRQALEWARVVCNRTGGRALVITPLTVAEQFVREGQAIGVRVTHCRETSEAREGINVTNYERFDRFDPGEFAAVVLDESSILKSKDGKTRTALIDAWQCTPFRLACTATPAPNDHVELGNHSEFLGVMSQSEMLAMFFVHDGGETQKWRLKGHAEKDYWRWVCSWAVCLTKPSELGYSNDGYQLPELRVQEHVIASSADMARAAGMLFSFEAKTLDELRSARRASLDDRVRSADLERLAACFADRAIATRDESLFQRAVAKLLEHHGIHSEEQVKLPGTLGRLDFLVGRVALELKVKGSLAHLLRQLDRYAQSDRVDALVVVTTRRTLARVPRELRGKPVRAFVVGSL